MQSGKNVYAALLAETTLGVVPGTLTGGKKFPINRQTAPSLQQALIRPGAITSDGQNRRPRGGSHSVTGSLLGDLIYTGHDDALQAALRGTYSSDILNPGLVKRSWLCEVVEQDIDVSTLSKGCRIGGYTQRGAPDQPITMEYPLVGITQEVRTAGASPVLTTPTEPSEDYMTATDAAIEIDGSPVLVLTGWEANVPNGAAGMPVVGSKFSPDIFTGNLDLTGSMTMVRESAALQSNYIANDAVDLVITASDLAGNLMIFRYKNLLFTGFTQALGEDNGEIVTIPFTGGKFGSDPIVQIERTAAA